jgi:hypothetical protein
MSSTRQSYGTVRYGMSMYETPPLNYGTTGWTLVTTALTASAVDASDSRLAQYIGIHFDEYLLGVKEGTSRKRYSGRKKPQQIKDRKPLPFYTALVELSDRRRSCASLSSLLTTRVWLID